MGRVPRDRVFFMALLAMGVLALALSYVLEPTPDRYVRMHGYGRVRVEGAMHTVDYLIVALRVGGVIALVSGAYLTYRSVRPDRVNESEALPRSTHDRYEDIPPEAGNPSSRAGTNFPI
jgi:hypothetical protein